MKRTPNRPALAPAPENIHTLAQRCVAHVQQRFGVELDYTPDTLSLLDHFVAAVVSEEGGGQAPPPGHKQRTHLIHLLAPTIGAYFGEVLRRVYPSRWNASAAEAVAWTLDFEEVLLRFNPVGAAAEALMEDRLEEWNGAVATALAESEALAERLKAAPPVPEEEFFALTTRFEVLQIAEDYLRERKEKAVSAQPATYSPADYARAFEEEL